MSAKERIKSLLLAKLHAVSATRFGLADLVASVGVREYAEFKYEKLRTEVLAYLSSLKGDSYSYRFAASRERPVLYGSVYAAMLEGLFGVMDKRSTDYRAGWGDYINGFQRDDGFYYDQALEGPSFEHVGIWHEGWGKKHLLGHVIIALARLGVRPKYPFAFLNEYYPADKLIKWMNSFALDNDVWSDSNYFMNLYTAMQYSRDWLNDDKAGKSVDVMAEWLIKKQDCESGMWHKGKIPEMSTLQKLFVVRGAYHFYPLFEYDGFDIPEMDKAIDFILPLQNRWGSFSPEECRAGVCEEIDALEPLIRFAAKTGYRIDEVKAAAKRSMVWGLASRCGDGGFSFYPGAGQEYGGHPLTTNVTGESSLFATWFRTLMVAYVCRFLDIKNDFQIGKYPGYEIA